MGPVCWDWVCSRGSDPALTEAVEQLRKILALERQRKFRDTAVVGGLDGYLLNFAQGSSLSPSHKITKILKSLPFGGYRSLHPIQRKRVVDELSAASENGIPPTPRTSEPKSPPPKPRKSTPVSKAKPKSPAKPAPQEIIGTLNSPVSVLPGITRAVEQKFAKIGVSSVRDLLYHFPTRYHDYSELRPIAELEPDGEQTVMGEIWSVGVKPIGRRRAAEAIIGDETGTLRAIWWGQPWVARRLRQGEKIALSGKVSHYRGRLQMDGPEIHDIDDESLRQRRLVPVYKSTDKLTQGMIRSAIQHALDNFAGRLTDPIPDAIRERFDLWASPDAIRQIHAPDSLEDAEAARNRFAFEELLFIEIGVVRRRREWESRGGAPALELPDETRDGFVRSLPFPLTGAQEKAIAAILANIGGGVAMNRLLEGDVGSGKTVVAAAALLAAVKSGYQGVIMAPTEILAEQHFRTFTSILDSKGHESPDGGVWFQETAEGYTALRPEYMDRPVKVALLTGRQKASEKAAVHDAISRGEVDIAVGTHALVQGAVEFDNLGLVVVDEQHRFGVAQRAALREKGVSPHVLVMTATPIPRTLALTVYGDLDITVLDEMPPGRPTVKTTRVLEKQRRQAWDLVKKKVDEGRQAYIICPLVEESDVIEAKAAVQEYERLSSDVFPELRLGLLHGRMTPKEKNATMRQFRDGELDILVSTAVVEVGIDVPNATVMLIEGADRFGLSQLHQFRGRVRRSSEQAYCLLLADDPTEEGKERLRILETVSDGFELAEEDLRIRGPGEYFGTRQSGMPDLRLAKLTDVSLIENTRREAGLLLDDDPMLEQPQHSELRSQVERLWGRITSEVS